MPDLSQRRAPGVAREMWAPFGIYQAICELTGADVDATGTPGNGSASRMPSPPQPARSRLSADRPDLALAAFLLKILVSAFFVRDRPGRASPRKSKKASDFPARKPGEPSVTKVTRRIEFHLLYSWQAT